MGAAIGYPYDVWALSDRLDDTGSTNRDALNAAGLAANADLATASLTGTTLTFDPDGGMTNHTAITISDVHDLKEAVKFCNYSLTFA